MDASKTTNRSWNISIHTSLQQPLCKWEAAWQVWEPDFNRQQGEREERAGACAGISLKHVGDPSSHHPGATHTLLGFDQHHNCLTLSVHMFLDLPCSCWDLQHKYLCVHVYKVFYVCECMYIYKILYIFLILFTLSFIICMEMHWLPWER